MRYINTCGIAPALQKGIGDWLGKRFSIRTTRRFCATALPAVLDHLDVPSYVEKTLLSGHMIPLVLNSRSEVVWEIRSTNTWLSAMNEDTVQFQSPN